ncbi:RNA-binding S4 domain-containing protein [Dongia deserti]|uniref:RNA-binding S4 domain-containing protein n=1 Tax=Dongia deserti TaxID=2268030 RepID=UPI000E64D395|nr:RNA-binding S4 domain-containing protein [Dongia deserti]
MTGGSLRLDKWLWFARFVKTRSLATKLVIDGRMRVNGVPTQKAHYAIKVGDVLTFPLGPHIRVIKVVALGSRRGPATEAQSLYEDLDPPRPPVAQQATDARSFEQREAGAGRPTKRDGRKIAQLKSSEPS